jgi:hypothetical protein
MMKDSTMSDELKAGDEAVANENMAQAETPVSESAPDSASDTINNTENADYVEANDAVQSRFNKLTAEKYNLKGQRDSERERAEKLEAELNQFKAMQMQQQPQAQPEQAAPMELPTADQYDEPELYNQQLVDIATRKAREGLQQDLAQQQQRRQQERQQQEQAQFVQQQQEQFIAKAAKLNIDPEDGFNSIQKLYQQGVNPVTDGLITQHPSAPALYKHLADNPAVFAEVNAINNQVDLVNKLNELASQAVTRSVSKAPEPAQVLNGMSATEPNEFAQVTASRNMKIRVKSGR